MVLLCNTFTVAYVRRDHDLYRSNCRSHQRRRLCRISNTTFTPAFQGSPIGRLWWRAQSQNGRKGKGTSGGARVLYLYLPNRHLIYFLCLFTKGEAESISAEGKKAVRQIAEHIKMEHRR